MEFTSAQRRIYGKRPQPNRKLIEARINAGLSCNQLAKRAYVSGNTVRAAEAGHYIEVPQQHAIAQVLGFQTMALFPLERQRVAA